MSNISLRPPRRTLSKTDSTPLVMADAFAEAGLGPSDFSPTSLRMSEPQSRPTPERASTSIPINVSRCISFGVSGKVPELDLHGCNRDKAYRMLEQFIRKSHGDGCREVLVITGKGSGTLKRLVPDWLEAGPFKEFVADTRVADPWKGGEGARYVRLKPNATHPVARDSVWLFDSLLASRGRGHNGICWRRRSGCDDNAI